MTVRAAVAGPGVRCDDGGFTLRAPEGTSYRVDITRGLPDPENPLPARYCEGRRVVVLPGPTVERFHGQRLRRYLSARLAPGSWSVAVLPGGERHKTMATVEEICARAEQEGLDRHGVMLAVGGGVTRDLVGFTDAPPGRVHVAYGYADQGCHVFLAEELAEELTEGEPGREPTEADMVQRWAGPGAWRELVRSGRVTDAAPLAAHTLLALHDGGRAGAGR